MAADLHVHSIASDGSETPSQLVELAKSRGLTALSLTDHDSTQGVVEASARGREMGVQVISGVEISCESADVEYHILGYGLHPDDEALAARLSRLRESRYLRMEQMVSRLSAQGIQLDLARVREIAGHGAVGRPHVAEALMEKGYAQSRAQAFQCYLNKGKPGYVPREKILPREAIALIRQAGGVAVWAHPGAQLTNSLLAELVGVGLQGIEVWHPDHGQLQVRKLLELANQHGLCPTGGSDFHRIGEGCGLACCTAPDWAFHTLIQLI